MCVRACVLFTSRKGFCTVHLHTTVFWLQGDEQTPLHLLHLCLFFFNRPFSTFKSTQMLCCLPFIHVTVFILSLLSHRAVSTNDRAPNVDTLCSALYCMETVVGKEASDLQDEALQCCSDVGDVADMPSAGKCSLNVALECRSPRK